VDVLCVAILSAGLHLASSADVGQALRLAKIRMLEQYGPQAVPKLWSGVLVYGDEAATVNGAGGGFQTGTVDDSDERSASPRSRQLDEQKAKMIR
jgi:hypothetical protein